MTEYELAMKFIAGFENKEILLSFMERFNFESSLNHMIEFIDKELLGEIEYCQIEENDSFEQKYKCYVSNGVVVDYVIFDTLHPWVEQPVLRLYDEAYREVVELRFVVAEEQYKPMANSWGSYNRRHPVVRDYHMQDYRYQAMQKFEFPEE